MNTLSDYGKTITFESEEMPFDLLKCKIGQEYPLTVMVKMVGENKDSGAPHTVTFKVVSIVTPEKKKKYKRNWLF